MKQTGSHWWAILTGIEQVAIEERSLHCVARRAHTARKKMPGYSGRNDGCWIGCARTNRILDVATGCAI